MTWNTPELVQELHDHLDGQRRKGLALPEAPPGFRWDSKGDLIAERNVPGRLLIEDQTVEIICAFGFRLANEIARFRERLFRDVATYLAILEEQYGARRRGRKGNLTLRSFDGRMEVSIQVQERIAFGPELHVAKELIDELAAEWTEGSRQEVRALINTAFDLDKEGNVNIMAVLRLRQVEIDEPRWTSAMEAISDAVRVVGSKVYARLYLRPDPERKRVALPIDIASDWTDPAWDAPRDPKALRARYEARVKEAGG